MRILVEIHGNPRHLIMVTRFTTLTYAQGSKFVVAMVANATMFCHLLPGCSVLARNEEFSKIAVIKFFFTVLKKKYSYLWGGFCGGNFEIYHANQQFSTCMLIDTHVNKRERYTISPVHDCAHCYCMHTCLLMLIKIQIENTQSTLESKNISFMGVLKKL